MHNKKPSELFVLKVFVVAEWKGFEPLRGYNISPPNDLANRPLRPLEYHSTN